MLQYCHCNIVHCIENKSLNVQSSKFSCWFWHLVKTIIKVLKTKWKEIAFHGLGLTISFNLYVCCTVTFNAKYAITLTETTTNYNRAQVDSYEIQKCVACDLFNCHKLICLLIKMV